MKKKVTSYFAVSLAVLGAVTFNSANALADTFKPQTPPISVKELAKDFDVATATISPDGRHIAAIVHVDGQDNPVVRVWETDNMSKTPMQFGSKSMRFYSIRFIKNDKLLLVANQPVLNGAWSDWRDKIAFSNLDGSKIVEPFNDDASNTRDEDRIVGFSVFNSMPLDPDYALIQINRYSGTDIQKVNLKTGASTPYARSGDDEAFSWSDPKGNIRVKYKIKAEGGVWYKYYYYRDDAGNWKDLPGLKQSLNDRYTLDVQHVSNDNKTIWVITDKDSNYAVLRKFDVATQTFSAPVASNTEFDLSGVSFGTADDEYAQNSDPIREICWAGPVGECQSKDETDTRIQNLIQNTFPDATNIVFRIKDAGKTILFSVDGPNLPKTFYLLKNETQLVRIGSMREGWDPKNLAPAAWVTYPARDGMQIPGVLYLPKGYDPKKDGRIPLVVLPHGGPWSRDYLDFDSSMWPQMFATRGFAVLQPNYRGSTDLGKNLWKAGDKEWGAKMQDDNDDGAKWLVKIGVADPDRMMLYGYSYGGFAGAAAAARSGSASEGLWQCAISGGPAIDLVRIKNDWGESRLQRVTQGVTVDGWNPMAHLNEIKIPWLIVHGAYDHQADIMHSKDAAAKMKSVNPNADFKFVQIDRMSHTLNKMLPEHKERLMSEVLNWTANHCGNISKSFNDPEAENMVKKFDKAK